MFRQIYLYPYLHIFLSIYLFTYLSICIPEIREGGDTVYAWNGSIEFKVILREEEVVELTRWVWGLGGESLRGTGSPPAIPHWLLIWNPESWIRCRRFYMTCPLDSPLIFHMCGLWEHSYQSTATILNSPTYLYTHTHTHTHTHHSPVNYYLWSWIRHQFP